MTACIQLALVLQIATMTLVTGVPISIDSIENANSSGNISESVLKMDDNVDTVSDSSQKTVRPGDACDTIGNKPSDEGSDTKVADNDGRPLICGKVQQGYGFGVWCFEDQIDVINGKIWCQNDEGGACTNGEANNCRGDLLCGRFNPDAGHYQCCSGAAFVDNQTWCQNSAEAPCSGGANNNCKGDMHCGRFSKDADSYQCCSQGSDVEGQWCTRRLLA